MDFRDAVAGFQTMWLARGCGRGGRGLGRQAGAGGMMGGRRAGGGDLK